MPEGPEVTILTTILRNKLTNTYLHKLDITSSSRYATKKPDNFQILLDSLPNKFKYIENKGKFIYFIMENGLILFQTLGMAGGWYGTQKKHTSMILEYSKHPQVDTTHPANQIYFVDQRHFATFKVILNPADLIKKLKELGPDLVAEFTHYHSPYLKSIKYEDPINENIFITRLRKYNSKNIVVTLMNQKVFSGIGNYLKSEILYHAKIYPLCNINDLTDTDLANLYQSARHVIKKSYQAQGGKIQLYSDLNTPIDEDVFNFQVYQQERDPNGLVIKRIQTADKRSTFYVPEIQIIGKKDS